MKFRHTPGVERLTIDLMRRLSLVLVPAVVVLAGCAGGADPDEAAGSSSSAVDESAWAADLREHGVVVRDWSAYRDVYADLCASTAHELALHLSVGGNVGSAETRTGFEHACPDRLPVLDEARTEFEDSAERAAYLCDTPRSELSPADRHEAGVVCNP